MREQQHVDQYCLEGGGAACVDTVYDSDMDATRFKTLTDQNLNAEFDSLTTGDIWFQYETYFDYDWAQAGSDVGPFKFTRARKNNIGQDDRTFDFQGRSSSDIVCNNASNCPAALPMVRCYDCSPDGGKDDPLSDPTDSENWQPGGDTAGGRNGEYTIDDHVADNNSPFLYIPGRWIRETYHFNPETGRLRVWMSDEEIDTTLLIADVDDSSLGFNLHSTSTYGINAINFNVNLSSDTLGETKITHWHRNLIVGKNLTEQEEQDLLAGRPGSSSDTTPPFAPSGLGVN
jgi:hypothetical protein